MTDDLVERLRIGWHDEDTPIWVSDAMVEAAARIEQLERELSISRMAQVVMDNTVETLTAERDAARTALKERRHD